MVRNRPKLLIPFLLVFCLLLNWRPVYAVANKEEKVNFVEVQLDTSDKIYEGLQERIEFSITRVGEKILLSQPVALLQTNKKTVEAAIFNVFSKVLAGFRLEAVDLFPGEHTKIIIRLTPIPPLISAVRVNLNVHNVNPEIDSLTKEISLKVEEKLNQVFDGLPVAAVSWSEGIFNLVVNYLLEKDFPGFNSRFSIQAGTTTEINLTLIPEEPVVSNVNLDYVSADFPAWLVKLNTGGYQEKADILKGIPVEFLIHYQPQLEGYLTNYLNEYPAIQRFGLRVKLGLIPGKTTQVRLTVASNYFQAKLEGRYFISNERNFGNIQAYLGYRTSDFELYTRYFWGTNPSGYWKAGLGIPIEDNFTGGLEYEFEHGYKQAWLHYQFERGDYLDLKLGIDQSPNEGSIGIFLNNHTNLELVDYDDNFGLQLMFHF